MNDKEQAVIKNVYDDDLLRRLLVSMGVSQLRAEQERAMRRLRYGLETGKVPPGMDKP